MMRYLINDGRDVYQKFEIDKSFLIKVKSGEIDSIIDTEENLYFSKDLWDKEDIKWRDIKSWDKRYE
jgi:hypothetical protein